MNQIDIRKEVEALDKERILNLATLSLTQTPSTITSVKAPLENLDPHAFFSQADYWWPDPSHPQGPFIRRDGQSNPENFEAHRKALRQMRRSLTSLTAAYLLTKDLKYASATVGWLHTFFLDPKTHMAPHLSHAQTRLRHHLPSRGEAVGLIDTLHLVEVPICLRILENHGVLPQETILGMKKWFRDFLDWFFHSAPGVEEMNATNNHAIAYFVQVACFAWYLKDDGLLALSRMIYRQNFIKNQMALDGSFPLELARTKPYNYSCFALDLMTTLPVILNSQKAPRATPTGYHENLWDFTLEDGRGIKKGLEFLYPFVADKSKWPFAKDVEHFEAYPGRHPFLLFGAAAFGEKKYFETWKKLPADPKDSELRRNLLMRQPLLWLEAFSMKP